MVAADCELHYFISTIVYRRVNPPPPPSPLSHLLAHPLIGYPSSFRIFLVPELYGILPFL